MDKERVTALEFALAEACDIIESAADVIDDYDPSDIDGESLEVRLSLVRFRKLLNEGKE